jgi:hypothetical protein
MVKYADPCFAVNTPWPNRYRLTTPDDREVSRDALNTRLDAAAAARHQALWIVRQGTVAALTTAAGPSKRTSATACVR